MLKPFYLEFALATQEFSLAVLAISILTIDFQEQLSDVSICNCPWCLFMFLVV